MKSRLNRVCCFFLVLLLAVSCRGRHSRAQVSNEEPEAAASVASVLKMSDQAASVQLLKGFHSLEGGAWRWTAGKFQVLLRPPTAAAQKGATLSFAFSLPDVVIQKLSALSLSASIGNTKLKTEKYSKPGPYTFSADVPAALLVGDAVTVDFEFDKSLPSGSVDQRELAAVATSIGLESK